MPSINGTAVAPGLALGAVHVVRARPNTVPNWSIRPDEIAAEIARLAEALGEATGRLAAQRRQVRDATGEKDAGIFDVHRMILQDPSALTEVETTIREQRINAEAAVQSLIDGLHVSMAKLEGANVRRYAGDVSEPWLVVLDILLERDDEQIASNQERVVLAAAELTPQVVTYLPRGRVLAVVTETGGRFSHGAVLARSFGIPCVVGLPNLLARLEQGMQVAKGCASVYWHTRFLRLVAALRLAEQDLARAPMCRGGRLHHRSSHARGASPVRPTDFPGSGALPFARPVCSRACVGGQCCGCSARLRGRANQSCLHARAR